MTNDEYLDRAWAIYDQGLSIEALSRAVKHVHHVPPNRLAHAVRTKLFQMRRLGLSVPFFDGRKGKQVRRLDARTLTRRLALAVVNYMESTDGPIHTLWEDEEINSPTYGEQSEGGLFNWITARLHKDEHRQQRVWEALLKDIRAGRIVSYLCDTREQEREDYPAIDLYLKAIATTEAMR